jgi:hypothetical protein
MKIDDYSSLESYAKGLFDGYMGKGITPEQTTLEDYLKGYNRAIFTLSVQNTDYVRSKTHKQTQPLDIKVIK